MAGLDAVAREREGLSTADTLDILPGDPDTASSPARVRFRLLRKGTLLDDKVEVGDVLGEGGMGQVYSGYDRWLKRPVAIKVGWPDFGASVLAEARAMAALRHKSVVSVFSGGHHQGLAYAVMELIHGPSLEAFIEKHPAGAFVALDEASELLGGIAQALAVVHDAGLAHRDVKPGNILLAPGNRIVLTDFGIFQPEIYASAAVDPAGSPPYMAPETITGTVRRGEAYLVDMYALGIVAFELLMGQVPFASEDMQRVIWMHLNDEPPDVRVTRPEVPPRLAGLVAEMLAKEPRARPGTMQEVAFRLQHTGAAAPNAAARSQPRSTGDRKSNGGSLAPRGLVAAESRAPRSSRDDRAD